jgi:hypothetical protein
MGTLSAKYASFSEQNGHDWNFLSHSDQSPLGQNSSGMNTFVWQLNCPPSHEIKQKTDSDLVELCELSRDNRGQSVVRQPRGHEATRIAFPTHDI